VIFTPGAVAGSFLIELEPISDERGFFARAWCEDDFRAQGVDVRCVQVNVSYNRLKGTIRGLHWQVAPFDETKLVRCTAGSVLDVLVDVRPGSPTYLRWQGVTLSATRRNMLFLPAGCAHGYEALEDGSEVSYQVSHRYVSGAERGLRWDDPAIGIEWPITDEVIVSAKDREWPLLGPEGLPAEPRRPTGGRA
jgi:dTDP-4-dehydrorhamnose 3,5-epimerase